MSKRNAYKKRRDRADIDFDEIVDSVDIEKHPHLGACCLGCKLCHIMCSLINCIYECFSCCIGK